MYVEIPAVEGTPESRIAALKEARELLKGEPKTTSPAIFGGGGGATKPRNIVDTEELIRLAEYITTGHDYKDTHPEGKRRPIQRITNVTVVAPPNVDTEDLEHFLHHVENGDFMDLLKDAMQGAEDQPAEGDAGESADEEPVNPLNPWDPRNHKADADPDRDGDTPPPAFQL